MTALQRLLSRQIQRPDQPYMPRPGQAAAVPELPTEASHYESESDVRQIHGSSIPFGTHKTLSIDEYGHVRETSQTPSYIIGSGKRVSSIDEIGGVCRYCQALAMDAFQEGRLSYEQMQLQSFFDVGSGCPCSVCGQYFCATHCRPIEGPEGPVAICVDCAQQLKRKQKWSRIVSFLLSPFLVNDDRENPQC